MFAIPKLPFELPFFTLPTAVTGRIQQRFLSFLLRRFLGHLVKPGQLDASQIEAQIGSGAVEIRNVELDEAAVNEAINGLPLKLKSAAVGRVAVQIPWQSFLTANVTLALEGLDVAFILSPLPPSEPIQIDKLAESIISVAQDFTHEALSPQDNEELRHSIVLAKEEDEITSQVPGALDPFDSVEDEESTEPLDAMEGVGVLASVMERLMSRLAFNAENLTLRLIHEDRAEFIFHIEKFVYGSQTEMIEGVVQTSEVRSVQVHGVTVSIKDLTPQLPSRVASSTTLGPPTPITPPYHESDGSDEEIDASMTQSMLSIRPESPDASLYMSATSSIRGQSPEPATMHSESTLQPPPSTTTTSTQPTTIPLHNSQTWQQPRPECILSFGHEPIILRLRTPQHTQQAPRSLKAISVSLDIGLIGLALRPRHIKALLEAAALFPSTPARPPPNTSIQPSPSNSPVDNIEAKAGFRSLVLVLLQSEVTAEVLSSFYDKPRSTPLQVPHIRLAIDSVTAQVTAVNQLSRNFEASVESVSIFVTHAPGQDRWIASPLLLVDHNLASQYQPDGPLPQFTVSDWTGQNAIDKPKKGPWMTPAPKATPATDLQAITVRGNIAIGASSSSPDIRIAPLHLFLYVGLVDGILESMKQITPDTPLVDSTLTETFDDVDHVPSPFAQRDKLNKQLSPHETPRAGVVSLPPVDSENVARLVINDMDENQARDSNTGLQILCSMIRIEVRCPSPPGLNQRSGALVVDLHDIILVLENSKGPVPAKRVARFVDVPSKALRELHQWSPVLTFAWHQAIIAFAPANDSKARGLVSLGPLTMDGERGHPTEQSPIIPKLYVRRSPIDPSKTALDVQIPLIRVAITKLVLDGLQFWADDLSQWAERLGAEGTRDGNSTADQSANTSMIGSQFFINRTASVVSSAATTDPGAAKKSEFIVKLSVLEVAGQLDVPRADNASVVRPLIIQASDLDVIVQLKPDGKDETVVNVSIMDLTIQDTQRDGQMVTFICLNTSGSLMSERKPLLRFVLTSLLIPDTGAKQSRIKISTFGFTYTFVPDLSWTQDLAGFFKAPPGAFEQVVPTERTVLAVTVRQGSIKLLAPNHPGALLLGIDGLRFDTDLVNESKFIEIRLAAAAISLLLLDDLAASGLDTGKKRSEGDSWLNVWNNIGFASLIHLYNLNLSVRHNGEVAPPETAVDIHNSTLEVHLAADSLPVLIAFFGDFGTIFASEGPTSPPSPTQLVKNVTSPERKRIKDLSMTYDENAFKKPPALGPDPDMVDDDLPTNIDYIDASYGTAAGVRDITDSDLEDFEEDFGGRRTPTLNDPKAAGIISNFGGETIKILAPEGLKIVEGYFDTLQESEDSRSELGVSTLTVRVRGCSASLNLYSGYDWFRTRKTIEDEAKAIRKKLEKIRQLLADGQTPDDSIEQTNATLFNSVYLGLPQDVEDMDGDALLRAIDAELGDLETASQSSWQSFVPPTVQPKATSSKRKSRRLTRGRKASIKISIQGLNAEFDKFRDDEPLASRVFATIRDLDIIDQMKTSTWDLFLTSMRSDSKGNVRETESNMVRFELKSVRPIVGAPDEEARFRLKVLPIKLHVDQDALDFLKQFFSFQDTNGFVQPNPPPPKPETYFQHVEVFPVELKLDYKPKRVDYKALKEGRTIELMNFFHFEGAEMTLRHITLKGLTGWAKLGDTLNDMWTPDVKANQLADVISGVSPIRSLVNVGTGVADLVLLPIAQYRKDKRIVRGVQKGTTAFMKSTAMEAIKLGARLASGTQVILEQAESVLGSGTGQGDQFNHTITAETMGSPRLGSNADDSPTDEEGEAWISKYADQPESVQEGIQTAYKSLSKNLHSAAQTILAVPMEVYERSGTEGPVRAVVRAVPIAVLKPMIGASEAISQTLWGLRNTLDPETRREMNDKYKQR